MKQTPIGQGKKVSEWNVARVRLKKYFVSLGITRCEVCPAMGWTDCFIDNFLSFAHKQKRIEYYSEPEKLFDINEVVLACQNAHTKMEYDEELTQKVFNKLRPEDGIVDRMVNTSLNMVDRRQSMAKKQEKTTDQKKSKKADFMKPRICKFCKSHNPGMAMCPNCKKWDM